MINRLLSTYRGTKALLVDSQISEEFHSPLEGDEDERTHEVASFLLNGECWAECWADGLGDVALYVEADGKGSSRIEALEDLLRNVRCRAELFERLEKAIEKTIEHEKALLPIQPSTDTENQ